MYRTLICRPVSFSFQNMLELSVYDEDACSQDDLLFTVRFDVAGLPLNEKVLLTFKSNPEVRSAKHTRISSIPETIMTNGVIVGPCFHNREEGSLNVEINSLPKSKKITLAEILSSECLPVFSLCSLSSQNNLDVRLGYDLCPQEQDFLRKRKNIVAGALKQVLGLETDLQDHEVPVVAIVTTGGSTRSLTAFYGSLRGLQTLNLIDCASYLSGLSGTTWTMGNLYKDANWSRKNLNEQINETKRQVTKNKLDGFSPERLKYYSRQLRQRKQEGQKTCLIDLWGLVIEYLLNDGKDNHKLSDQQHAVNEGQNPLPIYTAINVKKKYSTLDFKEWTELTPFEVGIIKYGAFVRTEDFGSEFFMGRLMKKIPESRICYLQDTILDLSSPNQLTQSEEYLSLEDTGFFINSSCAPLLRKERKVDLILHLNYNSGSQTEPLDQMCKYCKEQGIPFPNFELSDEKKHLKECYVCEDAENPEAPIVLFFPQVNDTFRYYKAPGVKRSPSEMKDGEVDISSNCTPYSTYSMTFSDEEFDKLLKLSEYNILNNKHLILQALHVAVERKKKLRNNLSSYQAS
ncbi:hypothetical protein lerEdw1_017260 [Lerista edwardsae]|nr:hypothetical protein lerEdw1_017260 [Lerista edwardsae]